MNERNKELVVKNAKREEERGKKKKHKKNQRSFDSMCTRNIL